MLLSSSPAISTLADRPTAPGHEHAQAGPEPERHPERGPGTVGSPLQPRPQAAHERVSSGQGIDYVIRIVIWVKCPSMYPDKK
jgi:hypothetical protein